MENNYPGSFSTVWNDAMKKLTPRFDGAVVVVNNPWLNTNRLIYMPFIHDDLAEICQKEKHVYRACVKKNFYVILVLLILVVNWRTMRAVSVSATSFYGGYCPYTSA